jgi:hypothetical protein
VTVAGLDDAGLWLAGVTAGLTALVVIVRYVRRLIRWSLTIAREIAELHEIAVYEMRPNGGGSIKDHAGQVPDVVTRLGLVSQQIAEQGHVLREHLILVDREKRAMWQAIEAVARAQPPED